MIAKWNNKVRKNDEVIIIGDFFWGNAQETNELLKRLNGKLYLIQGNTRAIPCNMINCFCKFSDYEPLTLDEWIICDKKRREHNEAEG